MDSHVKNALHVHGWKRTLKTHRRTDGNNTRLFTTPQMESHFKNTQTLETCVGKNTQTHRQTYHTTDNAHLINTRPFFTDDADPFTEKKKKSLNSSDHVSTQSFKINAT